MKRKTTPAPRRAGNGDAARRRRIGEVAKEAVREIGGSPDAMRELILFIRDLSVRNSRSRR